VTPDRPHGDSTGGPEKSGPPDSIPADAKHGGGAASNPKRVLRQLDRQADALEQLVYVLDPSKKPKKRGVARFFGYMMLASSVVLGGYEFVSWVFDQWERRAMIANWLAVAREMQDVENAPEVALDLLEKANEIDPQSADVVRLRAYVRGMQAVKRLLQIDRPFNAEDVAIANLAAAEASLLEQLDPAAADWALLRGQLAMALKEPDRASGYFQKALELDPDNVLVRVRFADMHHERASAIESTEPEAAAGERASAAQLLDQAIRLDPKSKLAWLYRGVHALGADPAAALESFDRAVMIDPRFELAHRNRGLALAMLERWDDAETALQRALEISPRSAQALASLSQIYGFQDQYESALLFARKATDADPDFLGAWSWRANLERDMGTVEERAGREEGAKEFRTEAIASYGKALDLDPRSADVLIERSKLLRRMGDLEAAGVDARQAVRLAPRDPYAWFALAEYQDRIREYDAAMQSLDRLLELEPKFDTGHQLRAKILDARGDLEAAESALAKAVEFAEEDLVAGFLLQRSSVRERRGNLAGALEDAVAARTAQSEDFELWIREAALLLMLDRREEACAALGEANQRRPETPEVAGLRRQAGCL
jgi:tetratricopeptide (TPR) repeat protein